MSESNDKVAAADLDTADEESAALADAAEARVAAAFRAGFLANICQRTAVQRAADGRHYEWTFEEPGIADDLLPQAYAAWLAALDGPSAEPLSMSHAETWTRYYTRELQVAQARLDAADLAISSGRASAYDHGERRLAAQRVAFLTARLGTGA